MNITVNSKANNIINVTSTKYKVNVSDKKTSVKVSGTGIQGVSNLPSGGNTDALLAKNSNTDHDYKWTNSLDTITIDAMMNGGYF